MSKKRKTNSEVLLKMEPVQEIIRAVLFSSLVADAIPLSILLVAESGSAKSKLMNPFKGKTIHAQDDLHTLDLHDIFRKDKNNELRHLIIPDLNLPLAHKPQVARLTLATLLGPTSAQSKFRFYIGRESKEVSHGPIGLVSACTPDIFALNRRKFSEIGLVRRVPPIFYTQGTELVNRVRHEAYMGKVTLRALDDEIVKARGKKQLWTVALPSEMEEDIVTQADLFTAHLNVHVMAPRFHAGRIIPANDSSRLTPIAPQLYLQTLIKAHAVSCGRNHITKEDLAFIKTFVRFANSQSPEVL